MHYFKLKGDWSTMRDEFLAMIPKQLVNDVAILFNNAPEVDAIFFATTNSLMASKIKDAYDVEVLNDVDFMRNLMVDSNRQWGVVGNRSLVNF